MIKLEIQDPDGRTICLGVWDGTKLEIPNSITHPLSFLLHKFLTGKRWTELRLVVHGDEQAVSEATSNMEGVEDAANLLTAKGHLDAAYGALAMCPTSIEPEAVQEIRESLLSLSDEAERKCRHLYRKSGRSS